MSIVTGGPPPDTAAKCKYYSLLSLPNNVWRLIVFAPFLIIIIITILVLVLVILLSFRAP